MNIRKYLNVAGWLDNKYMVALLIVAALLMLFRVSSVDLIGDDAVYSMRSIGLLDYMFADQQPTPLQFFEDVPSWALLSFHDHPPLVFILQKIFLSIHESAFFAKLPMVFMGLLSLIFLYGWVRDLLKEHDHNIAIATISSLLLFLCTPFVRSARVTYLEMGVIFFTILTLFFYTRFIEGKGKGYGLGISLGLLLLTKYTAFFMIPALLTHLAYKHRSLFKDKRLHIAAVCTFVCTLPVIIFNLGLYKTQGHFDVQFARLFHQTSPWNLGGSSLDVFANIGRLFTRLGEQFSYIYLVVFLISIVLLFFQKKWKVSLVWVAIMWMTIQFILGGPIDRFLPIYAPLIAVSVALGLWFVFERCGKKMICKIGFGVFSLYLGVFLFSSIVIAQSLGPVGVMHSSFETKNYGIAQLDEKFDSFLSSQENTVQIDLFSDLKRRSSRLLPYAATTDVWQSGTPLSYMILVDGDINWFVGIWLIERRRFYHNVPIFTTDELPFLQQQGIPIPETTLFVRGTDATVLDEVQFRTGAASDIEARLKELNQPVEDIVRLDGEVAFRVYEVSSDVWLKVFTK